MDQQTIPNDPLSHAERMRLDCLHMAFQISAQAGLRVSMQQLQEQAEHLEKWVKRAKEGVS